MESADLSVYKYYVHKHILIQNSATQLTNER